MPHINDVKKEEMDEIIDFYHHIQDYGHIFLLPPEKLDEPFKKIMDGINEVREMINDSYGR